MRHRACRLLVVAAIWRLRLAARFARETDRAVLCAHVPLLRLLTLSPTDRAREMSSS
jgi:hypothetical protein